MKNEIDSLKAEIDFLKNQIAGLEYEKVLWKRNFQRSDQIVDFLGNLYFCGLGDKPVYNLLDFVGVLHFDEAVEFVVENKFCEASEAGEYLANIFNEFYESPTHTHLVNPKIHGAPKPLTLTDLVEIYEMEYGDGSKVLEIQNAREADY